MSVLEGMLSGKDAFYYRFAAVKIAMNIQKALAKKLKIGDDQLGSVPEVYAAALKVST